jgi:hypothetical protein
MQKYLRRPVGGGNAGAMLNRIAQAGMPVKDCSTELTRPGAILDLNNSIPPGHTRHSVSHAGGTVRDERPDKAMVAT